MKNMGLCLSMHDFNFERRKGGRWKTFLGRLKKKFDTFRKETFFFWLLQSFHLTIKWTNFFARLFKEGWLEILIEKIRLGPSTETKVSKSYFPLASKYGS